ncbi:unnamed protein product, partial [Porites lobata]
ILENRDAINVCFVEMKNQEDCHFVVPPDESCDSLSIRASDNTGINVMLNKGCAERGSTPPFVTLAIIVTPPRRRPFCRCGLSTLAFE